MEIVNIPNDFFVCIKIFFLLNNVYNIILDACYKFWIYEILTTIYEQIKFYNNNLHKIL